MANRKRPATFGKIFSNKKMGILGTATVLVALAAIITVNLPILIINWTLGSSSFPIEPNAALMAAAFTAIQKGQLKADTNGAVVLSGQFSAITKNGRAYVTTKDSLVMVLFPLWIGKGSNVHGRLFCSRPLAPDDLQKASYAPSKDTVTAFCPGPWTASLPAKPEELIVDQQISPGVYSVFRSLD